MEIDRNKSRNSGQRVVSSPTWSLKASDCGLVWHCQPTDSSLGLGLYLKQLSLCVVSSNVFLFEIDYSGKYHFSSLHTQQSWYDVFHFLHSYTFSPTPPRRVRSDISAWSGGSITWWFSGKDWKSFSQQKSLRWEALLSICADHNCCEMVGAGRCGLWLLVKNKMCSSVVLHYQELQWKHWCRPTEEWIHMLWYSDYFFILNQ